MINTILQGLISFIISLINIFLSPINALVSTYLPNVDQALTSIGNFLSICVSSIGWVISAFAIPSIVINLIVTYYTLVLTVPLLVHAVKLAVKWYHTLMP